MHKAYPQVIQAAKILKHFQVSSKEARNFLNALFAVNYVDRQVRKDLSDHVRETVQFARHPAGMMSRFAVYRFFHNCLKPFRIKHQKETHPEKNVSHSEMAGLRPGRLKEILKAHEGKRFFLGRLEMGRIEVHGCRSGRIRGSRRRPMCPCTWPPEPSWGHA
jgi:hypothetical protein